MSRWSASTFVIVATVGESARNDRSYSSASTTNSSSPPRLRLPDHDATRPPTTPVGLRPAALSASVVITVVVVFPCVPAMQMVCPISTALARAGELGMVAGHRGGGDHGLGTSHVSGIVARCDGNSEPLEVASAVGIRIAAGDDDSSSSQQLGERAHPCAGDADKVDWAGIVYVEKCHAVSGI